MRKMLTGLGLAFFLTLAPAAAVSAETPAAPVAHSQVTPAPQQNDRDGGGNAGLWGLLGLAGLLGLMGMRRRHEHTARDHVTGTRPHP
ncbi:MYXO-CTERM domain-containing protein [Thermocatellispora tengchongensis]|uniref:MYXO-CTERM domain-containing protein n=2 Tax=Thermocatellispora tengchongensis TaxID=1073253 RepID=A0A840P7W4_9ACTN|nr:WGxxGxxG family protein [Thermocatellispora tengchongensis]MBB5133307.1 MYXO-CTERM domain-containing protein [Thermocatellispora tengchongensis]